MSRRLGPSPSNQAMHRLLSTRAGDFAQGASNEYARSASLDFSKIPVFAPGRTGRSSAPSPSRSAAPLLVNDIEANQVRIIVEPSGGGGETQPEALKKRTGEPPSNTQNLLVTPLAALSDVPQAAEAGAPQPVSLGTLRHVAAPGGAFVTGPPVAKSLAAIRSGSGVPASAGYTDWPLGFKPPDFDFNSTTSSSTPGHGAGGSGAGAGSGGASGGHMGGAGSAGSGAGAGSGGASGGRTAGAGSAGSGSGAGPTWTSTPTLKTAASEGASGSFYVAPGKYNTGTKEGGKDVSLSFSPAMSAVVQAGEQEHCDDFAEAYNISLKEAQSVLNANVVGKTFGPATSKSDAEKLVLKAIDDSLTHKALGSDKTKWSATYTTLREKTLTRDRSGWHSIGRGARTETATEVSYDMVKGSSQIGSHPSNSIIKY